MNKCSCHIVVYCCVSGPRRRYGEFASNRSYELSYGLLCLRSAGLRARLDRVAVLERRSSLAIRRIAVGKCFFKNNPALVSWLFRSDCLQQFAQSTSLMFSVVPASGRRRTM